MENNLHQNASVKIFEHAKDLRKNLTSSEKKLWERLRNRKLKGFKFRRQHPIANYILDFYCHEAKLGIEVDGLIHLEEENRIYDISRIEHLKELGIMVVRFTNDQIHKEFKTVLEIIQEVLMNKRSEE